MVDSDTGTDYNEFELLKFMGIIVNVVKLLKNDNRSKLFILR